MRNASDTEVAAFVTRLYDGTATSDDLKRQAVALHHPGCLPAIVAMNTEALDSLLAPGVDPRTVAAEWFQRATAPTQNAHPRTSAVPVTA
jgi:hypothetical protein